MLAVRVAPGRYLLAAGRADVGLVFVVDGVRYAVTGRPVAIGGAPVGKTVSLGMTGGYWRFRRKWEVISDV